MLEVYVGLFSNMTNIFILRHTYRVTSIELIVITRKCNPGEFSYYVDTFKWILTLSPLMSVSVPINPFTSLLGHQPSATIVSEQLIDLISSVLRRLWCQMYRVILGDA